MPDLSVAVLITVALTLFGAGVQWGIYKLTAGRTVDDLKAVVADLKPLRDDVILLKERTKYVGELDDRVRMLEIKIAGLSN